MALFVPQHRVDAPAVFVHRLDPAWDHDRIRYETEALDRYREQVAAEAKAEKRKPQEIPDHPVVRYHSGEGRYDLGATYPRWPEGDMLPAADYLSPGAWRFMLKRLGWRDFYRVQDAMGINPTEGLILACKIGLHEIEGDGAPELDRDFQGRLTDGAMDLLFNVCDSDGNQIQTLPLEIGGAVFVCSQQLTSAEKKA